MLGARHNKAVLTHLFSLVLDERHISIHTSSRLATLVVLQGSANVQSSPITEYGVQLAVSMIREAEHM